ncbi:hypothetical protein J7413_08250 [Shimia sp. R10_1]|uniref:hypothetical protein n=1 Tax=Shimia sp. R10_1 TaxID=2821095 RepID=UPI001ADCA477|nr:hypothetical protein [Shimia sp. R10_1]MBO9473525.1 hypothetical protein [Shimia sp. R10_1]
MTFEIFAYEASVWIALSLAWLLMFRACHTLLWRPNRTRQFWQVCKTLCFSILGFFILAHARQNYAIWRVHSFDVDGDGIFTANDPREPPFGYFWEQMMATDTAVNFAVFGATAFSLALLFCAFCIASLVFIATKVWQGLVSRKTTDAPSG